MSSEIKRIDPNVGTAPKIFRRKIEKDREKIVHPVTLNNVEKFSIQLDHKMGLSKTALMRKWRLSRYGLSQVLAEKIEIAGSVEGYLRKLTLGLMETTERIRTSIDDKVIDKASLPQRMVALGIGMDKALAITKHLDGTKDPKAPVIQFADRQSLEDAVRRRLQEIPLVEEVEPEEQLADIEEVDEEIEDRQLELFSDADGATE